MRIHMDPLESGAYAKAIFAAIAEAAENYERPNMGCMLFALASMQARLISGLSTEDIRDVALAETANMIAFQIDKWMEVGDDTVVVTELQMN